MQRLPPPCATHLSLFSRALAWQPGSMQRLPPPCVMHLLVLPLACDLQSSSMHRLPPPCATHLPVLSTALTWQPDSIHLLPPPCAIHLSVLPWAFDWQPGSTHCFCFRGIYINFYFILLCKDYIYVVFNVINYMIAKMIVHSVSLFFPFYLNRRFLPILFFVQKMQYTCSL